LVTYHYLDKAESLRVRLKLCQLDTIDPYFLQARVHDKPCAIVAKINSWGAVRTRFEPQNPLRQFVENAARTGLDAI